MDSLVIFMLTLILCFVYSKECHLSCKKIRAFVNGHNARRRLLAEGKVPGQPAASEMKKIVWDDELQDKGSKWASLNDRVTLFYSHNPDKTIPSGRFITNENLYWYSTTNLKFKMNPDSVIEAWFSEHNNFTFGPLQAEHFSSGNPEVGHYTQLVWSDTIYIGCAISKKLEAGWHHFFVVCYYGPPGNYLGKAPYKTDGGPSGRLICDHKDCSRPYGKNC